MTVFVVQKQMKLSEDTGILSPRFTTIDKAKRFGDLDFLLGPSAHPFLMEEIIGGLHDKLKNFNEKDYLLLVGNSSLIGVVTAIVSNYSNGRFKLLQWSGRDSDYVEIPIRIF